MEPGEYFPFTKLRLPPGEEALWCATNPTFHRGSEYGIVVTHKALYLYCLPFHLWRWFAQWRRLPLSDITSISFHDSRWRPKLQINLRNSLLAFRTPFDFYNDEMDFDRKKLSEAALFVTEQLQLQKSTVAGAYRKRDQSAFP